MRYSWIASQTIMDHIASATPSSRMTFPQSTMYQPQNEATSNLVPNP